MMGFILKYKLYFIGAIVGIIAGFLYYQFIGCNSGSCAITSKPVNSAVYFGAMGSLVFGMFQKENKALDKNEKE